MNASGPIKNKKGYTIEVDRNLCVTLAVCLGLAPNVFELDTEGKAIIKDPNGENIKTIIESAKGCPVNAIIVHHPNGKRIWPDPEVDINGKSLLENRKS